MVQSNTVFVVDDEQSVLDALRFVLESEGFVVEVFSNAAEMIERSRVGLDGCLLTDIRMPGMSGLDLHERLRDRGVHVPTIVVTGHGEVPDAVRAMKSGCIDFVQKPWSNAALVARVREAMQVDRERRDAEAERADTLARFDTLTPRERQVMAAVVDGRLNKQIAGELGLSHKTIEVHRSHVMEKMNARSLAELVRLAVAIEAAHQEMPPQ